MDWSLYPIPSPCPDLVLRCPGSLRIFLCISFFFLFYRFYTFFSASPFYLQSLILFSRVSFIISPSNPVSSMAPPVRLTSPGSTSQRPECVWPSISAPSAVPIARRPPAVSVSYTYHSIMVLVSAAPGAAHPFTATVTYTGVQ